MEEKEKEEKYRALQREMEAFHQLLGGAANTILEQEVSSYPIFVLSRLPVAIGIALYQPPENEEGWFIQASTLEELATKKVVAMEKVDSFRKVFKDPRAFFCLFVLDGEQGEFVFLPRPVP